jgi:hypothetical protein
MATATVPGGVLDIISSVITSIIPLCSWEASRREAGEGSRS